MTTLAIKSIVALAPLVTVGNSILVSWLVSLALIALIILFIVWAGTKLAGPPDSLPPAVKSGIWIIIAIATLIFLFLALGIPIP